LFGLPGWAAFTLERRQLSHDVYEKTSTYVRFMEFPLNCMLLIKNDLLNRLRVGQGKKGEMKNAGRTHDVIENKRK
jgi:hypothetical protein